MAKPIMAKATAVWLVDNTTLSFKQIADFVEMHELEIQGIADGDVAAGVKGFDPIGNNQLTQEELDKAQADPAHKLTLKYYAAAVGEEKRRGPRYTPLSKRQDRPASILWLVKGQCPGPLDERDTFALDLTFWSYQTGVRILVIEPFSVKH